MKKLCRERRTEKSLLIVLLKHIVKVLNQPDVAHVKSSS